MKYDASMIGQAREAALGVLIHNARGPFHTLPRTAGWGYPEPYTRDLMLSMLGVAVAENEMLLTAYRNVLVTLASNQSGHGHIPSMVHDRNNRGASDTTPLFLLATAVYRSKSGEYDFLAEAVEKALTWMRYQSPADRCLVAQQPTTDWRDEQWTTGYGLYVNTLVYSYLRMLGQQEDADRMLAAMKHFAFSAEESHRMPEGGFTVRHRPYYAFWTYKIYHSDRFDLLGNCLAMLSGIPSPGRTQEMISWIEKECAGMRAGGLLAVNLPPNFFPFIREGDRDWLPRYAMYNRPGEYHNGGIWPFICGFYVAALVSAGRHELAREKMMELTRLVSLSRNHEADFGFNEWHRSQDGKPMGEDWQTWSAALYLYAAECIERMETPFFSIMRWQPGG